MPVSNENERLVIIRHAPFSSNALREGLDVALVAAAFGQVVNLLFMGQGVLALVKEQATGAPGQKATLPTIDMLEMYDIDQLLVTARDLEALNLNADKLVDGVTIITDNELPELLNRHSNVLNF
ncbi:sulfurtransferase complex subunit TusC [Halomonas sp. 7T]|uniref:sulfurtransferase complex subunit TusC n=1 Tax=Halomonas sp. 7T TaxID=2893469 RepID=UPI0021D82CAC|nr:sulfurtransferase complex subunit TusC [Halomonas sp. 7T]UXZ55606.1 sulfurtransferase complex subunit TusC [Halomonas sp. 7T]